jgi:hypothetical protein
MHGATPHFTQDRWRKATLPYKAANHVPETVLPKWTVLPAQKALALTFSAVSVWN